MSRYTITVTKTASRHSDPDAVIGYDRPLQTFFLQAFPDEDASQADTDNIQHLQQCCIWWICVHKDATIAGTKYLWRPACPARWFLFDK